MAAGAMGVAMPPAHIAAQDAEEILSYEVRIEIPDGAEMVVTEEIRVRALGNEIRRGIYRDFPTSFPRSSGLGRIEAPFRVRRVLQDGQPARYELLSIGGEFGRGGVQVRIGDPDVFLEPGEYTYTIEYETERWVTFGDASDQLYWNVTGNGWSFPILSASARVRVEGLDREPGLEAWTGYEGSTEMNAEMSWDGDRNEAVFRTTGALGEREGLTIRVTIPKGVLSPPSDEKLAEWFRLDWGGYIDAGYLVLFLIAVYALMWVSVGRDPAKRSLVVQYEPPEGFSPAALGYLQERSYDNSQFAAALVSMAVKGAVRIEKDDWRWTLHKGPHARDLTPDEVKVFDELLAGRSHLDLEQRHHRRIRKAIKSLKGKLSSQLEREYFVYNRSWFVAGLVLSILGFLVLVWRSRFGITPPAWFLGLWLTGWTVGVVTMLYRAFKELKYGFGGGGAIAFAGGIFLLLFSIPFVGAEVSGASHPPRPRRPGPPGRLPDLPRCHRGGPAGPHGGSGAHARAVRALPAARHRAGAGEPVGRELPGRAHAGGGDCHGERRAVVVSGELGRIRRVGLRLFAGLDPTAHPVGVVQRTGRQRRWQQRRWRWVLRWWRRWWGRGGLVAEALSAPQPEPHAHQERPRPPLGRVVRSRLGQTELVAQIAGEDQRTQGQVHPAAKGQEGLRGVRVELEVRTVRRREARVGFDPAPGLERQDRSAVDERADAPRDQAEAQERGEVGEVRL
jgi:hypothetical protein